jgi:hypothetical protein
MPPLRVEERYVNYTLPWEATRKLLRVPNFEDTLQQVTPPKEHRGGVSGAKVSQNFEPTGSKFWGFFGRDARASLVHTVPAFFGRMTLCF